MPTENDRDVALRLPGELHDRIKKIAKVEDRSVNTQLVRFLRESVERYEIYLAAELGDRKTKPKPPTETKEGG